MTDNDDKTGCATPLTWILVTLVALRAFHQITWSWWTIASIPIVGVILIAIVYGMAALDESEDE